MEQDWSKIRTYETVLEAEIMKQLLMDNDIPAVVLNKQDVIIRFGKVELYVREEHVDLAEEIINNTGE